MVTARVDDVDSINCTLFLLGCVQYSEAWVTEQSRLKSRWEFDKL